MVCKLLRLDMFKVSSRGLGLFGWHASPISDHAGTLRDISCHSDVAVALEFLSPAMSD